MTYVKPFDLKSHMIFLCRIKILFGKSWSSTVFPKEN